MDMVEKNSNHFQKVDVRAADVSQMSLEFSHFLKFEQAKNLYQNEASGGKFAENVPR